jgi:hypothetical protein
MTKQRKRIRLPKPNAIFAKILIPTESPETTETVAARVIIQISITKTDFKSSLSGSTQPRSCRPAIKLKENCQKYRSYM